jgi:putative polymerase
MARNAAVIGIFLMLGLRVDERTVISTFVISAIAVAAVLLLESVAVTSYAALFEPGRYFEETRGISRFELDEIGLFANALGFDDRFAILSLIAHRTSSLFLEQVSLANFATVLTVFLVAMWPRLRLPVRVFFPLLIAAILVTNNSRTALAIALAGPIVYLLAPKLPQLIILGLLPLILAMALVVSQTAPPSTEDDLVGRLSLTIRTLYELDLPGLLGAEALIANDFLDSGYTFVIYASSVLGLIVLWLFYSLVPAGRDAALKRAGLMTGLYLFINLTVSGTSIFSIKTAALLWFLIGFLRHEEEEQEGASPSSVGQELRSAHKPRDAFG